MFWIDNSIVPTLTYAHPGSVSTASFTGGATLVPRIRNLAFDHMQPVECFTNLEWTLVEQGAQALTTAYGSSPITFLPTAGFPTSFQVADLGSAVPDG